MRRVLDPRFFAEVFSQRAIDHQDHGGYYTDSDGNLRCSADEELIAPSPLWLDESTADDG